MVEEIKALLFERWRQFNIGPNKPQDLYLSVFSKDQEDGKIFIYVFEEGKRLPSLIVKTRKDRDGINYFQKQYNNLNYIHTNPNLENFARYIPRPILCEKITNQFVYSETFVNGCQLKNIAFPALRRKYLEESAEWLNRFHRETCFRLECSDEELKEKVFLPESHFNKIKEYGLNIDKIDVYIMENLRNRKLKLFPFVFYHGDFSSYNILIINRGLAILDWEYSNVKGAPLLDLLNLLAYYGYKKFKGSFYRSFSWAFMGKGRFSRLSKFLVSRYAESLGIDNCLYEIFIMRFLLELVFLKDKERQEKEDILKLIDLILKRNAELNIAA